MIGSTVGRSSAVVLGYSGLHSSAEHHRYSFPEATGAELRHHQGYDAAAALFVDARLVAAAQQERWSGRKFDHAFPGDAIKECLRLAGLSIGDIDAVAHNFDHGGLRGLHTGHEPGLSRYDAVLDPGRQGDWFGAWFRHIPPITPVRHHRAHALYAVAAAGRDPLTVVIADGLGETDALSVFHYRDRQLQRVRSWSWRSSLGLYYSLVTQHLGWLPNSDEYKVMGLAAYGDPERFRTTLDRAIVLRRDGGVDVPFLTLTDEGRHRGLHRAASAWLAERFGAPRDSSAPVRQHHADLAAGAQRRLEEALRHVVAAAVRRTGVPDVALGGGVALNCLAIGRLAASGVCDTLLVPPAPGDDGTAIGAALALLDLDRVRPSWPPLPLLGPPPSATCDPRLHPDHIDFVTDPDVLARLVAQAIDAGAIVGWAHGRMEFGPRALGNRSIFADPRSVGSRDRVNRAIKRREPFRPLAPAVKAEAADLYFQLPQAELRHMTAVALATAAGLQRVPAVVHADGTARVQVVHRGEHPALWRLLDAFESVTGVPVLLNTSLNVNGRPIARTADDAVATYDACALDMLVVDSHVLAALPWQDRIAGYLRRPSHGRAPDPFTPAQG